jgi:hypothetical protein
MHMRNSMLLLVTLGALAACTRVTMFGHTVRNDGPAAAPRAVAIPAMTASSSPITRIAIEFTPAARQQTEEDVRFNPESLRDALIAELRARQLLDLQPADTGRALVIRLEEFQVRATSNVVMFGRLASTGVLDGLARISEKNSETQEFRVRTEVPMQIVRNGDDPNPLKLLYRGFAEQFADALGGAASPPRATKPAGNR